MWDFSIFLSMKLVLRTMPFLFLRAFVFLIFTAILLLSIFGGFTAIGYLAELKLLPRTGLWLIFGSFLGLMLAVAIIRWLRSWALYLVKAAHIAVLVELVQGRSLPEGRGQIGYGRSIVKERFGEASALFLLDAGIRAALNGIDRITFGFLNVLPGKTAVQIAAVIRTFLNIVFGHLDELVLAHAIDRGSDDPWGSAREALGLYGQSWTTVLKNAFWLTMFTLAPVALILWFMVLPAWTAHEAAPDPETFKALLIGILLMAFVAALLAGPFALICLMQVWFRAIIGERPSPEWRAAIGQYQGTAASLPTTRRTTRNGDLV